MSVGLGVVDPVQSCSQHKGVPLFFSPKVSQATEEYIVLVNTQETTINKKGRHVVANYIAETNAQPPSCILNHNHYYTTTLLQLKIKALHVSRMVRSTPYVIGMERPNSGGAGFEFSVGDVCGERAAIKNTSADEGPKAEMYEVCLYLFIMIWIGETIMVALGDPYLN